MSNLLLLLAKTHFHLAVPSDQRLGQRVQVFQWTWCFSPLTQWSLVLHLGYTHIWLPQYFILLQFSYEQLFRSLQFTLLDNACREYLFISEFFMLSGASAAEMFNFILGKTLDILLVCGCIQIRENWHWSYPLVNWKFPIMAMAIQYWL